ncbi:MAG: ABC transporter permease [Acetobacteraceae bacterium]
MDGARRVQAPLLLAAGAALAALPFLTHARNRLISGQPLGLGAAAALAGAGPGVAVGLALGAAGLLVVVPLLRPGWSPGRWLGLAGAGAVLAAAGWLAGHAAAQLAAASAPAARTSLGAGCWVLIAAMLLIASDTARRLRLAGGQGFAAAALLLGPLALLLGSGELGQLSLLREYAAQRGPFGAALERHVLLVVGALLPALLIGIPLGVLAQRRGGVRRVAFPVLNLIQTVPSIALFGLLIGPLSALAMAVPALGRIGISGVGVAPALIALVLYSLLPIVRNTVEGLDGIPRQVRTAARGMGMTPGQAFWRVDAWLALPVMLSGVRVTAVQAVGLAAVSALIGAGGFGAIIFQGLFANALDLVLLGTLPVILLAVAVDLLFRLLAGLARSATGVGVA